MILYVVVWGIAGCIDGSTDAEECLSLEKARCEFRHRCDSRFDLDACRHYYSEQCRARKLPSGVSAQQLESCIQAIDELGSPSDCESFNALDKDAAGAELCHMPALLACQELFCVDEDSASSDTVTEADDSATVASDTDAVSTSLLP